jgi:excisionase family DNA binding protein
MSIQSTGLGDEEIGVGASPKRARAPPQQGAHGAIGFVVSPKRACVLLDCSRPTLYGMISSGELESYTDGRSRKITVASIRKRIADKVAAAQAAHAAT